MSFFKDMIAVFKKRRLSFVERIEEAEHVHTFIFEKSEGLTWNAGQHGLFEIVHKKVKNGIKPFTIAASPRENVVKITTQLGEQPSDYKSAMLELKQGVSIQFSGPLGSFYFQHEQPSLFIAGGMGITAFRAIVKDLELSGAKLNHSLKLLYADGSKPFIFKDELGELAQQLPLEIVYLQSREELREELQQFIEFNGNEAKYYTAGPKSMVDSVLVDLKNSQISKRNMIKDPFY